MVFVFLLLVQFWDCAWGSYVVVHIAASCPQTKRYRNSISVDFTVSLSYANGWRFSDSFSLCSRVLLLIAAFLTVRKPSFAISAAIFLFCLVPFLGGIFGL